MDALAGASGVSKATVYKHWENKDALLMELIERSSDQLPEFDSGNPRADLISLIRFLVQARKREELGRIWPGIIGYAVGNPGFAQALQRHSFGPRRAQIARLLKEAVKKGELRDDIDCDFALDLLIGPIMHRRFANQKDSGGFTGARGGLLLESIRNQEPVNTNSLTISLLIMVHF
jgi:AcrR family transcriptional regulator